MAKANGANVNERFVGEAELQAVVPSGGLFHYTNVGGLHGILDRAQLWGTHIAFLNDTQELEYGVEELAQIIRSDTEKMQEFKKLGDGKLRFNPTVSLRKGMDQSVVGLKDSFQSDTAPFVSCLSSSRDRLSQWRGYGKGGGFAIRFNEDFLKHSLAQVDRDGNRLRKSPRPVLKPVVYDPRSGNVSRQIRHLVDTYLKELTSQVAEPYMTEDQANSLYKVPEAKFFENVIMLASRIKSRAFAEEDESRVICRCRETFYSESLSLGLIPRTAFRFSPDAIEEIIIGPSEYADVRRLSVQRFLDRHRNDYSHVEVTPSKIPYRDI